MTAGATGEPDTVDDADESGANPPSPDEDEASSRRAPLLNSTRRRRIAFYGVVLGVIVAVNSGLVAFILTALQFNDATVQLWDQTLRGDTLSLVALVVVAMYLDFLVRYEEEARFGRNIDDVKAAVRGEASEAFHAGLDQTKREIQAALNQTSQDLQTLTRQTVEEVLSGVGIPLLERAVSDPLSFSTPEACVRAALGSTIRTHTDGFQSVIEGVLGSPQSAVIDDASLKFKIKDVNHGDQIHVVYEFTGRIRTDLYGIALARTEFSAESQILGVGQATDTWIILDEEAFRASLALSSHNKATVKYRDERGLWKTESRSFVAVDATDVSTGLADYQLLTVDLSTPVSTLDREVCIEVNVQLPSMPLGFRWIFDNPVYVHEILFDVSQLWPQWAMDFTLYPFLLGTDDYTQRSADRRDTYRIGVHSWLSRGHGVILTWQKLHLLEEGAAA